jgi:hypothetical protein
VNNGLNETGVGPMNEHKDHKAGTVNGCKHCTAVAYEPSWYASLQAFGQDQRTSTIVLGSPAAVSA